MGRAALGDFKGSIMENDKPIEWTRCPYCNELKTNWCMQYEYDGLRFCDEDHFMKFVQDFKDQQEEQKYKPSRTPGIG